MKTKQKAMSKVAFAIMTLIMNVKKKLRNIQAEISLAEPKLGDIILDFGCGLGFNTLPAAKLVGTKGKVYALDVSEQAVQLVKKKARLAGLSNIVIIHSDCKTGLETKSVDVVYLHNVFPLIEDKESVLAEIIRVLKPGGRLSLTTGRMARRIGRDTMSDQQLTVYLHEKYRCRVATEVGGHYIFQKLKQ
jgi:ubiquinone/menaquinone biosynthesis C-methylase UbiE